MADILLVDDSEIFRKMAGELLAKEGHRIRVVEDGECALEEIERHHPHILLLDINMPVMDGWVVIKELRSSFKYINFPIIVTTTRNKFGDIDRAYRLGADDYLVKDDEFYSLPGKIKRNLEYTPLEKLRSDSKYHPNVDENAKHIMIADDSPVACAMMKNMLEEAGYRASVVPHGYVAMRRIPKAQPDLLLLDIEMPGSDGFEVLTELKSNPDLPDDMPIVIVSVRKRLKDFEKAMALGAADYIVKDENMSKLLSKIKEVLSE